MASGSSLSFFSVSLDTAAKQSAIPISKIHLHENTMPIFDITHEWPAGLKAKLRIHRPCRHERRHRTRLETQASIGTFFRLGKNHLHDDHGNALAQMLR